MKRFLISSAVAASILTTAGFAAKATDGTGQFLVAPAFYASNGFETELKLINTNLTQSVVVRVVIRDFVGSEEIDFIVGLTPSDVWDARIFLGEDGAVYVVSTDDSNFRAFTSKQPVRISGVNELKRTFEKGYVEFYPMGQWNEGDTAKVEKGSAAAADASLASTALFPRISAALDAAQGIGDGGWEPVDNDSIAGYVTLKSPALKAAMVLPMMAFEDVIDDTITNLFGGNRIPTIETVPTNYINPKVVYDDTIVSTVTVPYEAKGVNDGIYFTFWGDYLGSKKEHYHGGDTSKCLQQRQFGVIYRDMEENRHVVHGDEISGFPGSEKDSIVCEFNSLIVGKFTTQFERGMAQIGALTNIQSNQPDNRADVGAMTSPHPSAIITNMRATVVNGAYSFSWTYPPVK